MKVMQINCLYKKGSTGKIVYDIHNELTKRGFDSVVCYGRGKKTNDPNVYKVCGELYSKINNALNRISGIMYGGCFFSTNKLISVIKKEKPDIVHLHCINGYFVNIYRLVTWLKKNHIKTVLTLHAEFMYTGGCGHSIDCDQWSTREGCGHSGCPRWRAETKSLFFDRTKTMWRRMKKAFDGFNKNLIVTSVSPWLMERAKISPIFEGKEHRVVLNGLDTTVFHLYNASLLKEQLGLNTNKIVFHATPCFNLNPAHIKGGYYLNEIAKRFKDQNVTFIVAGPYENSKDIADNIVLLGRISDQKMLAQYYSLADVTLLTSKKETFSMVTAESLCCGTPLVGFKAGAPEQISIKEYSQFVEYSDLDTLETCLKEMLMRQPDKETISRKAIEKYGKSVMCDSYIETYMALKPNSTAVC